jgi:glucosamine kinase
MDEQSTANSGRCTMLETAPDAVSDRSGKQLAIGVDGGGTTTRLRIEDSCGTVLAVATGGPSGLGLGVERAWETILATLRQALARANRTESDVANATIGIGLAGVHNSFRAAAFLEANPLPCTIVLETDSYAALVGAHGFAPGAVIIVGTGSVGESMDRHGTRRVAGGWGFPSGDEGSGAWLGLRAVRQAEHALDKRAKATALAEAVLGRLGKTPAALFAWLEKADQSRYAAFAPLVLDLADAGEPKALEIVHEAAHCITAIADAIDPDGDLPIGLCGGLAPRLRHHLTGPLVERLVAPKADATTGALHLARQVQSSSTPLARGDRP